MNKTPTKRISRNIPVTTMRYVRFFYAWCSLVEFVCLYNAGHHPRGVIFTGARHFLRTLRVCFARDHAPTGNIGVTPMK